MAKLFLKENADLNQVKRALKRRNIIVGRKISDRVYVCYKKKGRPL